MLAVQHLSYLTTGNEIKELDLPEGEQTTSDKEFTLEKVNCVGACSIAPVVIINNKVYGKVSADNLMKEVRNLKDKEIEK